MTLKTIRLACVALEAGAAAATSPTSWVQVALSGDYAGYPGGGFRFTVETFGQLIRNFRSHPSFELGPMGEGVTDVIPWDFNHASELSPTSGSIPREGAPAQAWAQDLQLRIGRKGVELWAKTRWLEPARTYVKNGQYKWASVTVIFDARDPRTGQNLGALLTSVAFTNQPFIEGMSELVAASRGGLPEPATKRVINVSIVGVNPRSPLARAMLAGLAKRLSTPKSEAPPADEQPTAEEQELARATKQELARSRDHRLPAKIDASGESGRNALEKAILAMRKQVPDFERLSWEAQCQRASEALRLGVVRV